MTQLVYDNAFEAIVDDPIEVAELTFRSHMLMAITDMVKDRGLSQADLVKILKVPQPRVSELLSGKFSKLSSDKLIYYAKRLGFELTPKYVNKMIVVDVNNKCD